MKNLVLTFVLALLVVLTCVNIRRMVAGTATSAGQKPTVVAIGPEPYPPLPAGLTIGPEPYPPLPPGTR
jgi:hypothetical protein